jgi:ABC-2 type transport system ATP-binding protein
MTENAANEFAVEVSGLSKMFRKTAAVNGLDLQIKKGTIFGFIGPNGAGKTTTIKMLMGLLKPDGGKATVLGLDPQKDFEAIKQRVGYVPEQHLEYRWMKVREVIKFCRTFYEKWNDEMCGQLMEQFKLKGDDKVKWLSKGMLAKLSLLLAVSHEPELLLLDEPTGGLDPLIREEFLDGVVRTASGEHQTVFFSSHTISDVQRFADTVGIINEGQLLCHKPVDLFLEKTKRIRLLVEGGTLPHELTKGAVYHYIDGRECVVTVDDFEPGTPAKFDACSGVKVIEVVDVGLEDILKDYIRGRRQSV